MLADDMACNARNALPATVYNHYNHHLNVYDEHAEVDYRGSEVTVDNFIRLLTSTPYPDFEQQMDPALFYLFV